MLKHVLLGTLMLVGVPSAASAGPAGSRHAHGPGHVQAPGDDHAAHHSGHVHGPGHTHARFSAGEPGDPSKPSRTVTVRMRETGRRLSFEPARIEVRKGEQIRFVLQNDGIYDHEFVLATPADNREHAKVMKKHPDMVHDDPNAKRLSPYTDGEILWRFTKRGEFEFACLIPGHREAGMRGKVIVK